MKVSDRGHLSLNVYLKKEEIMDLKSPGNQAFFNAI